MELLSSILVFFAGLWAGTINSVVGSGTLVTFPVLIALGYAPVTASISNAMGLVAGNAAGAWGYRKELEGRGQQLLRLLPASLLGGITGAWLLLHLPGKGLLLRRSGPDCAGPADGGLPAPAPAVGAEPGGKPRARHPGQAATASC